MEMHLRKLRMLQTCKKYGDVLKAPEMLSKRNTLIWDLKDGLIYCRIAKVGPFKSRIVNTDWELYFKILTSEFASS